MTRRCPWKKRRPAATPPPAPQETPRTYVRGEHEFRIAGYSTAGGGTHYSIISGAFHVGGHTWALDCRFDKEEHGGLAYVSLELLTAYLTEDVVAKARLRIQDPLGRWPDAEWRSDDAYTFPVWGGGRSWTRFEAGNRSWKLPVPAAFRGHESRYLEDDHLTILCTLEVLQEEEEGSAVANDIHKLFFLTTSDKSESSKLELDLELESDRRRRVGMMPDVTFVAEQTEIQAHRLVLAMRSPVFAAQLLGDMRESTMRRLHVEDMRASTFRAMIRFIYTDKLPIKTNKNDAASSTCKEKCAARRRVAMACDLLVAADRYDLEKLRLMCENILSESLDVTSVMPILMAVDGRHSFRQLEASCIEYLAADDADVYNIVKATKEYKELEESCNSWVVEVMNKVAMHKLEADSSSSSFVTNTNRRLTNKMTVSVSSCNTSEAVHGTLKLRIPNFCSVLRSHGAGSKIASNTLQIDGYDLKLVAYPNEGKIYVFAELLTDPGTKGVRASVCFRMDDLSDNRMLDTDEIHGIFTREIPSAGFIYTSAEHEEQGYLVHDGSVTIYCDVVVTNKACITTSATSDGVSGVILAPPPTIAWYLKQLLMSEKGSDVTFLVEMRKIRAHMLVIATRSPVLYEVANKWYTVIPIYGMKAAVFEAMLHFIYSGELPPMEDIALAASANEDVLVIAGDMLAAANRFRLDRMRDKCETLLAESITKQNAASMLKLARQHYCIKLTDFCDDFLSSPFVDDDMPRYEFDRLI